MTTRPFTDCQQCCSLLDACTVCAYLLVSSLNSSGKKWLISSRHEQQGCARHGRTGKRMTSGRECVKFAEICTVFELTRVVTDLKFWRENCGNIINVLKFSWNPPNDGRAHGMLCIAHHITLCSWCSCRRRRQTAIQYSTYLICSSRLRDKACHYRDSGVLSHRCHQKY